MNSKVSKAYKINKYRYAELRAFAIQYHTWKHYLAELTSLSAVNIDGLPHGGGVSDPTASKADELHRLSSRIKLIEDCCLAAGGDENYYAILKGVTTPNSNYNWLHMKGFCFCGRRQYYEMRYKFYYILDKEKTLRNL